MKFEEKLKERKDWELWKEYCGFLDLTIDEFMAIQNRLMLEQIRKWRTSGIGKTILKGRNPETIEEFRKMVPLTSYEDYADSLSLKDKSILPDDPVVWIQTTWEGGRHTIKLAPYTRSMLETYQNNMLGCLMLSTSSGRGDFDVNPKDTILYALAPLPYATGIFPLLLNDAISIEFLPPVKEAQKMSFSERNKKGFKKGLKKGIDFFFGVGSVTYYVSLSIASLGSGHKSGSGSRGGDGKKKISISPAMVVRLLKAKHLCRKEGRDLLPKDLFRLKGFMCAGTDNRLYRDDLEKLWGVRPMEIFAGTEPTCIGTEIWSRDGMYFFPDACFYEFIPEKEMERSLADPSYEPRTCLMNEVEEGEKYELVISVLKGGVFMRYRVGDVYRCIALENERDQVRFPRFEYIDRIPTVIDIAGFTRITENSIGRVIGLSGLKVKDWAAAKEITENKRPFLHMYVEMEPECLFSSAVTVNILKEHMGVYFKYVDEDYKDLKKILGIDPLEITILRCGTFDTYYRGGKEKMRRINPTQYEIGELLKSQELVSAFGRRPERSV
ncbi:GH3 family domain-containing protein [Hungatella sp. SB206]|uniref:GH3 family domain-containing protein n=1 Tax=Hungatella sp. SB206 TaxID=2937758 RepID=UPI003DA81E5E